MRECVALWAVAGAAWSVHTRGVNEAELGATEGALLCGEGGFEPVLRRFWGRLCKTNWRSTLEPGL